MVTIFDRGSRWFSAYPTSAATADAAVSALELWIAQHGVPEILISDRGSHFESSVFRELMQKAGIEKRRTTAYHPQANGAVERQHRRLKEALKAKCADCNRQWLKNLPWVLLGLRNSISDDTNLSAAQRVYGHQLNIPGCVFETDLLIPHSSVPNREFVRESSHVPKDLSSCEYVWLRKPSLGSTLSRPYMGPFQVLSRNFDKNIIELNIKGRKETVNIERVKPAYKL